MAEESLPVLRSIHTGYGEMPQRGGSGPDPIQLQEPPQFLHGKGLQDRGNAYIKENFPLCDFVSFSVAYAQCRSLMSKVESAEWVS